MAALFGYADQHTGAGGTVDIAFTDRHGGVSRGPYATLNLALHGGDDPEATAENLRRVATAFNPSGRVAGMRQVHEARVVLVAGGANAGDELPEADGLVTTAPGVALLVRVADCVPVLLADAETGVVGAAHAGRKGLVAGVVPATVSLMRAQGAGEVVAWVGPSICGRCYELPAEVRDEVASAVPAARSETSWGTPAVDVAAGVIAQLDAAGVEVVDARRCTRESGDLYSFRRDGERAGRFAGLVRIRP